MMAGASSRITRAGRIARGLLEGHIRNAPRCHVCGHRAASRAVRVISDALASAWELSPQWRRHFDEREGVSCSICGSNRRSQFLAETLLKWFAERHGSVHSSLRALARSAEFHRLDVAEINACGSLHPWIAAHPRLAYSEYRARPPIRREDLMSLSYKDESFDLVLTSETLEHVPDVDRALSEIWRVLRPGGVHVFTVPVIWDRAASRKCAEMGMDGVVRNLRPPSYHGLPDETGSDMLVFVEFGADIVDRLASAGFHVRVERDPRNPAVCAFVTEKSK